MVRLTHTLMTRTIFVIAAILIVAGVVGVSVTAMISAETGQDVPTLLNQIVGLEDKVANSHLIAMEQARVMLTLIDQMPKQYAGYSMEEFSDTGGYDPKWLEDNRDIIMQTCADAQNDGFSGLGYCQYVS